MRDANFELSFRCELIKVIQSFCLGKKKKKEKRRGYSSHLQIKCVIPEYKSFVPLFVFHQSQLGIPMIYGIDAVDGHNNAYNATIPPLLLR